MDVHVGGAALFAPAAPAGAFWAAARCVAAMEKTTAENPPAQLQASRGARFHGTTYPPTRCEVHSIQTFAMPARERAEPNGAVADARFGLAEVRRTPARRRCGAPRAFEPSRSLLQPLRRLFDDAQIGFTLDVKRRLNEAEVARHIDVPL